MTKHLHLSILLVVYSISSLGQNAADTADRRFRDDLLDHLVGKWKITSVAHNFPSTAVLTAEWVLNHQYLHMHFKGNEVIPWWGVPMEYEVFFGYNHYAKRYTVHGMSIEGDEDPSEGFAYGYRNGNEFKTVAKIGGDSSIVQRHIWEPETRTWKIQSRLQIGTKESELFLDMKAEPEKAHQLTVEDEQFVDSIMNANYKNNEPGAVLLIAKNGVPVYEKGYGLANIEFNIKNEPKDVFRIASMTKQFTAVCILKLAQEQKINLQDDIRKYLPTYNSHGRKVTIENILTHTSGIRDPQYKEGFPEKAIVDQSREEILNSFMNDSLLFEPGTDWSYSNSGYMLAGYIVEEVSGLPLSDYMQKNIFEPVGMLNTSIGNYDTVLRNAASGYFAAGTNKYKPIGTYSWNWQFACGDMISNVEDLLKWDNSLYTDRIVKKEWLEKAWKPFQLKNGQTTHYGLGFSSNNFNGVEYVEHAGGLQGFSSDAVRVPSQQLYIVMLSNRNSPWPPNITSAIALQMTGQSLPVPTKQREPKTTLKEYEGNYTIHRVGVTVSKETVKTPLFQQFTVKSDTLYAQFPGYSKAPLLRISKDLFRTGTQCYFFRRNELKKIIGVEIYNVPIQVGPKEFQAKTDIPIPKEKIPAILTQEQLSLIKGKYTFSGGMVIPVMTDGTRIFIQFPGEGVSEFFAENENTFFTRDRDITLNFIKSEGNMIELKISVQGTQFKGRKVE